MRYPLASTTWDQAEVNAIAEVLKSGRFTMGDKVREFERKFADYFGAGYAIMTVQDEEWPLSCFRELKRRISAHKVCYTETDK